MNPPAMETLTVRPLTPENWPDFERLFGRRGACGGCWCMFWRQTQGEFEACKGEENRRRMRALVRGGEVPGLIAYSGGEPCAWCSLGPRSSFSRLARSRVLKPVDERPVWSLVCFFVSPPFRRRGVTGRLISASVRFARERGAEILEAYPIEPRGGKQADVFLYTGIASAFRRAGFTEAARRSPTRPVMRRALR